MRKMLIIFNNFFCRNLLLLIALACFLPISTPESSEWINYTKNNDILGITIEDNTVWLQTWNGLALLNKMTGEVDTLLNSFNTGLPDTFICRVAIDKNKNKWFATSKGLTFFNGLEWKVYTKDNSGLLSNDVFMVTIDDLNNKWILARNSGVTFYNDTNWTVYSTGNSGLPTNYTNCIAIDRGNKKWIGTNKGIVSYNDTGWVLYDSTNTPMGYNQIINICIDSNNNKWVLADWVIGGIFDCELWRYNDTTWTLYAPGNPGIPHRRVISMTADKYDRTWFGIWYRGVVCFDGKNYTLYDSSNSGLPNNWVYTMAPDDSGNIWAGTEVSGLSRFDGTNPSSTKKSFFR